MPSPSGSGTDQPALAKSKVEDIKELSGGLYGDIAREMAPDQVCFSEASYQLLKHHGTYQQDNRDTRSARKKAGLDKDYRMMVRTKTPGGRMTAETYLACDDLADKYGQGDLRVTSRQGFQFHGVLKGNLRSLIHDLNLFARLHTRGACGDVVRNVMCSPVADIDLRYQTLGVDLIALSGQISDAFLPPGRSYFDLFLDDERVSVDAEGNVWMKDPDARRPMEETIYGNHYLPRKFKIGMATDFDNSIDVYIQDLGIIAVTENGKLVGYEVLAGGGLGHSHSKKETYPRLGSPITFVAPEDLMRAVTAVIEVQRDLGNRENRNQARLKYTIDTMGLEAFRAKVGEYFGRPLPAPRNVVPSVQPDFLGWHKQMQPGMNFVGLWIENGRIRDFEGEHRFRTGLRRIIERFRPSVRLTPHHNVILADIRDQDVNAVNAMLAEYRIPTHEGISPLRRWEMACPALPLCGLALAEAERELPALMKKLEELGHADDDVMIRMTGCPNSCARPETSEIGIVGRGPNKYNLYTGGSRLGERMNELLLETVTVETIPTILASLLSFWRAERAEGETFGGWSHRVGVEALRGRLEATAVKG